MSNTPPIGLNLHAPNQTNTGAAAAAAAPAPATEEQREAEREFNDYQPPTAGGDNLVLGNFGFNVSPSSETLSAANALLDLSNNPRDFRIGTPP